MMSKTKNLMKTLGPGLIFASSAIGTSHLVLSTRAGAHHGMVYFWIIMLALLFKYPFFEFGPRYASASGHSLLKGYKDQGMWAVYLFLLVIVVSMFAVTGAVGAVTAGLLSTIFGWTFISVPALAGVIILITVVLLISGGYKGLDFVIKIISASLLIAILVAFVAVLMKGPIAASPDFVAPPFLEGAGLTLLIGLIGWMPTGLEASAMNSIWVVEKQRTSDYKSNLKEILFDFNLGYAFTAVVAVLFLVIGAFTVYGSGELLDGGTTDFSSKLLNVFTANLGTWAYPFIAIAAFGTIYGTLITVLDAFSRSFVRGLRAIKFDQIANTDVQLGFLKQAYFYTIIVLGIGGFSLFYFSTASMIRMLEWATIISFLVAPIMGVLNLKVVRTLTGEHKVPQGLMILAYVGLVVLTLFVIYYMMNISAVGH